jgi:hypothetical protein
MPHDNPEAADAEPKTGPRPPSLPVPGNTAGLPGSSINARRWPERRTFLLVGAAIGLVAVLVVDVTFIARAASRRQLQASSVAPEPPGAERPAATDAGPTPATPVEAGVAAVSPFDDEGEDGDGDEGPTRPERPKHFATVRAASVGSCSTASVDGLSRQIIEQVRCSEPRAFVPIPARPNLVLGTNVYAYMESSARDHLVKALDENPSRTMTINSALRTMAQQYLVRRWAADRRCGVQMATLPGDSNHETGRGLDIAEHAQWRSALEKQDFHWLGSADLVHFDFESRRSLARAPDVLAFQRLWNRNHPDDRIAESGDYDRATAQRLEAAPPDGFERGPTCARSPRAPRRDRLQ